MVNKGLQVYRIFVRSLEFIENNWEMRPHNGFRPKIRPSVYYQCLKQVER